MRDMRPGKPMQIEVPAPGGAAKVYAARGITTDANQGETYIDVIDADGVPSTILVSGVDLDGRSFHEVLTDPDNMGCDRLADGTMGVEESNPPQSEPPPCPADAT